MAAETANAEANSAASVISSISPWMRGKDGAFVLRHLANLLSMGVRNRLLQLEGDGLRIR